MKNIQAIIESFKNYSEVAKDVYGIMEKYDYRSETSLFQSQLEPSILPFQHPTLRDLYMRLSYFIAPNPYKEVNLPKESHLNKTNLQATIAYLNASKDQLTASKLSSIPIEPTQKIAESFYNLGLMNEATLLSNISKFLLSIRKWYKSIKNGKATTINLTLQFIYTEATPTEIIEDACYRTFASLFKTSCNFSTPQKRALYNALKELYSTTDHKVADRTVMAVILLFRKPKTKYRQPFITKSITNCKEIAMQAFGRDTSTIKSYSENSLEINPKIAVEHVKRAESIIKKALESTR